MSTLSLWNNSCELFPNNAIEYRFADSKNIFYTYAGATHIEAYLNPSLNYIICRISSFGTRITTCEKKTTTLWCGREDARIVTFIFNTQRRRGVLRSIVHCMRAGTFNLYYGSAVECRNRGILCIPKVISFVPFHLSKL